MRVASAFVVAICSMWLLSQPGFRRAADRVGVWQFGLSERRVARQSGERRRRNGCDAQGRGVRCRHPQERFQLKERADRSFLNPGYAKDGNHPAVLRELREREGLCRLAVAHHGKILAVVVRG